MAAYLALGMNVAIMKITEFYDSSYRAETGMTIQRDMEIA